MKDLSSILFGKTKTRRAILSLRYGHTDESYYLRQIVRTTGFGLGPIQRELKQLTDVGVVRRSPRPFIQLRNSAPELPRSTIS